MKPTISISLVCLIVIAFLCQCSEDDSTAVPRITSFEPVDGTVHSLITINGTDFPHGTDIVIVKFNDVIATIASTSPTQVRAFVPEGATTGKISVGGAGFTNVSDDDFSVIPTNSNGPEITSFTPTLGLPGSEVIINGQNFSADKDKNIVRIGNILTEVAEASPTSIKISVPAETATGKVFVQVGNQTTASESDFIISKDEWAQKADFGGVIRSHAVSFVIGEKAYVGGGFGSTSELNDFWEYDPEENTWTRLADFEGQARASAVSFAINGKGYIGTGIINQGGILQKDFWEYDPNEDDWERKADFAGPARHRAVSFSIGGKGYVGTGEGSFGNDGRLKDFWEYDPEEDTWVRKADFAGDARYMASGLAIDGKGYIGLGTIDQDATSYFKDFWEYDPSANTWSRKADFEGVARTGAISFTIGKNGYVGTGRAATTTLGAQSDLWLYSPASNTWTRRADYNTTGRYNATGFSIGNTGYLTGGQFGLFLKDLWEYQP